MKKAMQILIDAMMKNEYHAERSTVTGYQWVKTADKCWVCAYVRLGATDKDKPTLFMVHWSPDSAPHNPEGTVVVYKTI